MIFTLWRWWWHLHNICKIWTFTVTKWQRKRCSNSKSLDCHLKKKKKKDVFGKGGAASGNKILRRDLKNSYRDPHISKTVGKLRNLSYFLIFKWYKRFSDDRENVMDGVQEGKPNQFVRIFVDWVKRQKICVELNGDYITKKLTMRTTVA